MDDLDLIYFCGFSGHVKGDLDLSYTPITHFPSGLTVGGLLDLMNTQITQLPSDLKVGRDVYLFGSGVPEGTKRPKGVKGELIW